MKIQSQKIPAKVSSIELLDIGQICEIFKVEKHAVLRWVKAGTFPQPIRFSRRHFRWRVEDVRRFYDSHNPNGN